jgi:hypothetical protein
LLSAIFQPPAVADPVEREESRFVWPPLILAIVLLWLAPLATSLGLDECGNWWVVKDGLKETIARARFWPGGQSLLFDFLVLGARAVGGDSDIAMRIPSVLASLTALFLLYRLGTRLLGPLAAMFGCLAYVCLTDVVYVASTLRPYALGLMCVIGAMLALVTWLDTGRLRYAAAYSLLAALSLYTSYFFVLAFIPHAIYAGFRIFGRASAVTLRNLILAWAATAALLTPLLPQVLALSSERAEHSYMTPPSFQEFLVGSIVIGLVLSLGFRQLPRIRWDLPPMTGRFLALWTLIPPGILCIISLTTPTKLFVERYYLTSAPAVALLAGAVLRSIQPARSRRLVAASVTICAILQLGVNERFFRGTVNWRGAARILRQQIGSDQTPVLAVPGYNEAATVAAVTNPRLTEILFAPYFRYPIPGRLIPLPNAMNAETELYLERVVLPQIQSEPRFVLLGLGKSVFFETWLRARCRVMGFKDRTIGSGEFGSIYVFLFERADIP